MTLTHATDLAKQSQTLEGIMWKSNSKLRNEILSLESVPMTEPISFNSIIKGEIRPPESVQNFLKVLYTGSDSSTWSSRISRLIDSSAADAVYAYSGGKPMPGKYLALGLSLKLLTRERPIVPLMNRFVHCVGNETVRRLDISLESNILKSE